MEEFEIKFLEVDVDKLQAQLIALGAEKAGEYDYSRALFDYPNFQMYQNHAWVRLRTDGIVTTLTYKQQIGAVISSGDSTDSQMKEIEVTVSDYEKTYTLLKSMGLIVRREEKNRRIRYTKGGVVFDIDFWPFIPPYLEIESTSYEAVRTAARELGFDPKDGLICAAKQVYAKYGIDKEQYSSISFEGLVKKTE